MATNRQGKMINFIQHRMRVTLQDGRTMVGQMLAFDKHMNLVLADTHETRMVLKKDKSKQSGSDAPHMVQSEERRTLGLIILRGAHVVSVSVESGPPPDPAARLGAAASSTASTAPATISSGPGMSRPAGRGMPTGLTGPAPGAGGPGFGPPGGQRPGMPPGFQPPPGIPPSGFGPPGQPPNFNGPPGPGRGYPYGYPPGFNPGR